MSEERAQYEVFSKYFYTTPGVSLTWIPAPVVFPEPAALPGLLCDTQITALAAAGMIAPFTASSIGMAGDVAIPSYGLSSYGYDVRMGAEMTVICKSDVGIIDARGPNAQAWDITPDPDGSLRVPPLSFAQVSSVERFAMPADVIGIVVGKHTLESHGIFTSASPLEPEWCGYMRLYIRNHTAYTVRLHPGDGIAQVLFFRGAQVPRVTYAARGGKYQNQTGVTTARV